MLFEPGGRTTAFSREPAGNGVIVHVAGIPPVGPDETGVKGLPEALPEEWPEEWPEALPGELPKGDDGDAGDEDAIGGRERGDSAGGVGENSSENVANER